LATVLAEGQLEVKRQGGFQVGKGLDQQGKAVVALAGQAFEFKFRDHDLLHASRKRLYQRGGLVQAGRLNAKASAHQRKNALQKDRALDPLEQANVIHAVSRAAQQRRQGQAPRSLEPDRKMR
jgi:hypothetical protein